jgi:OOP family OmpA-OmpF porin
VLVITKTEAGLKLTGFAPDAGARKALEAAAPGAADETRLASGLPAGVDFGAVVQFGLAELAGLKSGEARLEDAALSIKGVAPDAASGASAEAGLANLPKGVALASANIEKPVPPPPPAMASLDEIASVARAEAAGKPDLDVPDCDSGFKAELAAGNILFESGSATISPESYRLIGKLAGVALRCQVQQIEVGGHTDSQGDDALNDKLSQQRAEAVAAALAQAGVPADRLAAVGYGAKRPVASNDSEEGRAKNRRIEFTVK